MIEAWDGRVNAVGVMHFSKSTPSLASPSSAGVSAVAYP
jgi:hypothetical protein